MEKVMLMIHSVLILGLCCQLGIVTYAATIDYSCLHWNNWKLNRNGNYSTIFSASTDILTSSYISTSARRRLAGTVTPTRSPTAKPTTASPTTASPTVTSTTATLTTGWKVTFNGIPLYYHNMTSADITKLNSRPNAATDFSSSSKTTAKAGTYYKFGASLGYASTQCTLGYWPPGPDCPSASERSYVFPIKPAPENSTNGCYASLELGYFVNGIPIWNWADTTSYNSQGVWHNSAIAFEWYDIDICLGHAASGEYHHHSYSGCLMEELGDVGNSHSPLHGFAYDGYPIYGPYQAANTLAVSCWQARDYSSTSTTGCSDSARSCVLKDPYNYKSGTTTVLYSGPAVGATVTTQSGNSITASSGAYFEDYFFNSTCYARGGQYLDSHNGHDHDDYGYHYHLTMDSTGVPTFPFSVGPKYYGCLPSYSQLCGSSYLYGALLFGTSYATGTSSCGATSASSNLQCTSNSFVITTKAPSQSPTRTPTKTPTYTPTRTPTKSPTYPPSKTPTVSPTLTPTRAPSVTPTRAPTNGPTLTPTRSPTVAPTSAAPSCLPTITPTSAPVISYGPTLLPSTVPTLTPSLTPSHIPTTSPTTVTPTSEPSMIPSQAPSNEPTIFPTETPSFQPSEIPTLIPSERPTDSPTVLPTESPSNFPTQQPSVKPSVVPSFIPSVIPSITPSRNPTQVPSKIPTIAPTVQVAPTRTPTRVPTLAPSRQPTVTPTLIPTNVPSKIPTFAPSTLPSVTPSLVPTIVPTLMPSILPTTVPTQTPSHLPTDTPTLEPTISPSFFPTDVPSLFPTVVPSILPTVLPSLLPTAIPSMLPTAVPSMLPTVVPSVLPTAVPSYIPSQIPSVLPSLPPTQSPSITPTVLPSASPTIAPSKSPTTSPATRIPTKTPTASPTVKSAPTRIPTVSPSFRPSIVPTRTPTTNPSYLPTAAPSVQVADILSFSSVVSLSQLTSSTLDTTSRQALLNSTAKAMGIGSSYLSIQQETTATSSLAIVKGLHTTSTTYRMNVTVGVLVNLVDFSQDAGTLYSSLTTNLHSSSTSGTLSQYIQQAAIVFGSTVLSSAGASVVSTSPATVVNPPTYSPTTAPSIAAKIASNSDSSDSVTKSKNFIAGIVVGCIAFVACGAMFVFVMKRSRAKSEEQSTKEEQLNEEEHHQHEEQSKEIEELQAEGEIEPPQFVSGSEQEIPISLISSPEPMDDEMLMIEIEDVEARV